MAREHTLLRRLADCERQPASRAFAARTAEDLEILMESVRQHLVKLLNARHGMSEAVPDYGLPTLTDLPPGLGNREVIIENAIRTAVEKFEPRLRRVRVTGVHDEEQGPRQTLVFRVDALLIGKSGEHRVWYETAVSGDGQFDVSG